MRINRGKISGLFLTIAITGLLFFSCNQGGLATLSPEEEICDTVLAQVHSFNHFIRDSFRTAASGSHTDPKELQRLFLKSRILFKKFEWAAEYFVGAITHKVNGPPVQEIDNADLLDPALVYVIDPSGLQVIEEMLFPQYDGTQKKALLKQLDLLESDCNLYTVYFTRHRLSNWRILDAARLEVFSILTLGITGYDNPLTLNSMNESAASLESLKKVIIHYTLKEQDSGLIRKMNAAINYLRENTNFNTFNRAEFITRYENKISTGITTLEEKLNLPDIKYNRLLRQHAKTLFDTNAFNVNAFAPGPQSYMTPEKVHLGKKLFFEASLSGTGTRSCASCHQPDKAFTDGLVKNFSIHDKKPVDRNTPTLINAALQSNLFYDMRALTLEDQVSDVVRNKAEMDGSLQAAVKRVSQNTIYKKMFSSAFPERSKNAIDTFEIMNAIASYIRSLTKLNSRFDQYMRGDSTALSRPEINGFNLFMGKAKCATCHFMPLFSGITPPKFIASEAEVIGVPQRLNGAVIDRDPGWYNTIGVKSYKHAFKTPSIRNAARTAPYMHNGAFANLDEVIDFYNHGGGAGTGIKVENQTLSSDSLHLTTQEKHELIAFIKSLDSQ